MSLDEYLRVIVIGTTTDITVCAYDNTIIETPIASI
jgi:hypothetical protein